MSDADQSELEASVANYYRKPSLEHAIMAALKAMGVDPEAPRIEDLAAVDEFHTAGRAATLKAVAMIPLQPGMTVLDAGCGIGGTARHLARVHHVTVTGIDLTPDYIGVAQLLTERLGLANLCAFRQGSVLAMPFDDSSFDAATTFHVAMNIADRPRFYAELARVLKPGAWLCIYDILKGPTPGLRYPVPWAETETTSFLRNREETRVLLEEAGFEITAEDNLRAFALNYFQDLRAKVEAAGGPPPLGLHLLTGENSPEKFANLINGYKTHQIEPVILVARRS